MAKARYHCQSRLLISSRDSVKAGIRVITVQMHHHYAHEPYVDSQFAIRGRSRNLGKLYHSGLILGMVGYCHTSGNRGAIIILR